MSIPDPVTTGLVVAGTLQAAKQAQDLFSAITGHPGESIATILGNIAHRRLKNAEAVGNKSHHILLNIGLKAGEIPLNVLQPLLEGASVQEDEYLQDIWANLLANAADPRAAIAVLPSYSQVLKHLTSRDAKFILAVYNDATGDERKHWAGLKMAVPKIAGECRVRRNRIECFNIPLLDCRCSIHSRFHLTKRFRKSVA